MSLPHYCKAPAHLYPLLRKPKLITDGGRKIYIDTKMGLPSYCKAPAHLYPLLREPRLKTDGASKWFKVYHKLVRNHFKFRILGLYEDDMESNEMDKEAEEAESRLPVELLDYRNFRINRANYLSMRHEVLPKDQWTLYEDPMNHYLKPYLDDVWKEIREKEEWNKQ